MAMTRKTVLTFGGTATALVALFVWVLLERISARSSAQPPQAAAAAGQAYVLDDSHFHLTNYAQEGLDIHDFLKTMGTRVGRVALFGIPLQQMWDHNNTGDFAPTYYLQSDAPLYYYSFTDAYIAMTYKSLTPAEQARFDPMITGFNPADMYAADHIRRVLRTFPGVFSGIGESTRSSCRRRSRVRQPACSTRRSIASLICAPKRAWWRFCTTTSTCRSRNRARNPGSFRNSGTCCSATRTRRSSGRTWASAAS
jgi:hypothetical protein